MGDPMTNETRGVRHVNSAKKKRIKGKTQKMFYCVHYYLK
jgi:hypothetical protein